MNDPAEFPPPEPRWRWSTEANIRQTAIKGFQWLMLLGLVGLGNGASAALMLGIDGDTGNLYQISTTGASLTLVGNTGLAIPSAYQAPADLQFAPDGTLYCFTTTVGTNSMLYRVNPNTASASLVGYLGLGIVFEGGLAFSPSGTAYGANAGTASNPQLFSLNLQTGHATIIGTISGSHDINGLAWRSDGMLVGLDRVSNSLLAINPQTAASSTIASLSPIVGGVGGMTTADGNTGYFSTAGPGNYFPGSDALYSFNLFSGACSYIGTFSTITGNGLSGIALQPATTPALNIARVSSNSFQIAWLTNFTGYTLQYATNLHGAVWSTVTNAVTTNGGSYKVTCVCSGRQQFYRVYKLQMKALKA